MKIIGGKFKNCPLFSPKGNKTRPTSSLLRKAIFDILRDRIENARVLDLFAGTGAIAIEAISRGASHATLVEKEKTALAAIYKNIAHLGIEKKCTVYAMDALVGLKRILKNLPSFNFIYIDPPYAIDPLPFIAFLDAHPELLSSNALIFLEGNGNISSETFGQIKLVETRKFGSSFLQLFLYVG